MPMAPATPALRSVGLLPLIASSMFKPMSAMPAPTTARAIGQPRKAIEPKVLTKAFR
ncbi:hypothetical protein D3C84_1127690 [compost metagenome]